MDRLERAFSALVERDQRLSPPFLPLRSDGAPRTRSPSRNARVLASILFTSIVGTYSSRGALPSLGPTFSLGVVLLSLAFLSSAVVWIAPGERSRVAPGWRRPLPLLLLGLFLAFFLVFAARFSWTEFLAPDTHTGCLRHALGTGLLLSAGLFWIWRRTDPFAPRALGAAFGALGGAVSGLSVTLACGSVEGYHLLVGHGTAALVFALLGALLGRRILSP